MLNAKILILRVMYEKIIISLLHFSGEDEYKRVTTRNNEYMLLHSRKKLEHLSCHLRLTASNLLSLFIRVVWKRSKFCRTTTFLLFLQTMRNWKTIMIYHRSLSKKYLTQNNFSIKLGVKCLRIIKRSHFFHPINEDILQHRNKHQK